MFRDILVAFYEPIKDLAPKLPNIVLTVVVGYFVIKVIGYLTKRALKVVRVPKTFVGIIVSLLVVTLWVILASEIADSAGLSKLALTISGSLVALAFTLANGATLLTSDLISGLFLAKDKDFDCGARVKIGDIEGTVKKLDIRKVRIEDDEGNIYVIPNAKLDSRDGWKVIKTDKK